MTTFIELYKQAVEEPTPRQVFLKKVESVTGAKPNAVMHWVRGTRVPKRRAKEQIASILGREVSELFPNTKERATRK